MPGVDGDKFASQLKGFSPRIQICMITGDPDSIDSKFLKNGIDRVIKKPLQYNTFCNLIGTKEKKVA